MQLKEQLAALQAAKDGLEADKQNLTDQLGKTQTELGDTKAKLGDTETELGTTKGKLGETETELGTTKGKLTDAEVGRDPHTQLRCCHTSRGFN